MTPGPARPIRWIGVTTTTPAGGPRSTTSSRPRRPRRLGLRLVLDDRAPLPVRGLRGHPQRHPTLHVDRGPDTERIRLGTMFNVVPQWNPLRLAEDFSTLHNLSGGRGILGVGRGTVPREVLHLNDKGVSIGSHDNPDQAADDDRNRRVFEESMEIIRLALAAGVVQLPGRVLPDPGARHPRPGFDRPGADPGAATHLPVRDLAGRHQPARRSTTCPSSTTAPCSGTSTTRSSSASGTPTPTATPPRTTAPNWPRTSSGCS